VAGNRRQRILGHRGRLVLVAAALRVVIAVTTVCALPGSTESTLMQDHQTAPGLPRCLSCLLLHPRAVPPLVRSVMLTVVMSFPTVLTDAAVLLFLPRAILCTISTGRRSSRRKLGNTLDLSRTMSHDVVTLNPPQVVHVAGLSTDTFWQELLRTISRHVSTAKKGRTNAAAAASLRTASGGGGGMHTTPSAPTPRALRICILGFMGPLWPRCSVRFLCVFSVLLIGEGRSTYMSVTHPCTLLTPVLPEI